MKKSVYTFLAALFFLCLFPRLIHAEEAIPLFLNGKALVSTVPAQNIKGTTMVPIRIISETLGAVVSWDAKEKKVTVMNESLSIEMQIDKKDVAVNGELLQLTEAPLNVEGTALLPLRFLAEKLGLKVIWDEKARSVNLSRQLIDLPVIGGEQPQEPVETPVSNVPSEENTDPSLTIPDPIVAATEIQAIASEYDQVTIRGNGDLHPTLFYLTGPDRLVVDFEQSSLAADLISSNQPTIMNDINTILDSSNIDPSIIDSSIIDNSNIDDSIIDNTIENTEPPAEVNYSAVTNGFNVSDSVYIDKVRYADFSDKPPTVRVVIDLKQKGNYELIEDKVNHVVIIAKKTVSYTVVIDAGHGGKDTGAISVTKRLEKDFNLAVVLKIQKLLQQEPLIQVNLTRDDDTFVELDERVAIANRLGANLFVSVHGNSYAKTSKGTETYYYRKDSLAFAQAMHPHIVAATGFVDKKVKQEDFRVINKTKMPAILCEIGYLSNPTEEAQLYNEDLQNRVAAGIVAGIKEYLKIS
ncbi:AMIN domain-containing protein [Paenibacillus psychroresistens]|uniref:AMIN domain-containing protein n=1 Tax=Paenibacillus psychroresistens TaxID=1778678 RepID=A0A6B8RMN9_9BACL|nr:N-acetylmuramoyl-L-alanine amidase [Paenibacillus psychroresistens]QGQ96813.1 AMIN domain-containing protein [Paenibacillus psychroresistens]